MHPTTYRRFSTSLLSTQTGEFKAEQYMQTSPSPREVSMEVRSYQLLRRRSIVAGSGSIPQSRSQNGSMGWNPDMKAKGLSGETNTEKLSSQMSLPSLSSNRKFFINVIGAEEKKQTLPALPRSFNNTPKKLNKAISEKVETPLEKVSGKHLLATFQALEEASRLQPPSAPLLSTYCIPLPPPRRPQTLIFDLEETLVHICSHPTGQVHLSSLSFNVRPYALQCLHELSSDWEIVVFASSERWRVEGVMDYLDRDRKVIDVRLYQENCLPVDHCFVKDLRVLEGRDARKTIIVDDSVLNFAFQLDNGIPIKPWYNNQKDTELLNLIAFLREMKREKDVRVRLRNTFDLHHFREDFAKAFNKKEKIPSM